MNNWLLYSHAWKKRETCNSLKQKLESEGYKVKISGYKKFSGEDFPRYRVYIHKIYK